MLSLSHKKLAFLLAILSGKTKSQQVEVIKQLIRQNHYKDADRTMQQCIHMGLSVSIQ